MFWKKDRQINFAIWYNGAAYSKRSEVVWTFYGTEFKLFVICSMNLFLMKVQKCAEIILGACYEWNLELIVLYIYIY
jgi:hypothetical protein